MRRLLLPFGVLLCVSAFAMTEEQPLLLRQPTMNRTHIVFAYAGDLWSAPRGGGEAVRLTVGIGDENSPHFSPDGTTIAFTGEYDGNVDVYTMPATGGTPKRMTFHPSEDYLVGWTPDGRQLLFFSGRSSDSRRYVKLFTLPITGGLPAELPLPTSFEGAYSPDGARLAYEPLPRAFEAWKRYRGGMASYIWIANLSDSSIEKILRTDSNDFNAMWVGDKVYFLSDREGPVTLFAYDTKAKRVSRLLNNSGFDIKSASAATTGDAIVYEQFGALNVYDLKSGKTAKVNVTINADQLAVRPRYEKVGQRIASAVISPTGARAVFEARG